MVQRNHIAFLACLIFHASAANAVGQRPDLGDIPDLTYSESAPAKELLSPTEFARYERALKKVIVTPQPKY